MKNLIFVVLIAVAGFTGYNFMNGPAESVEPIATQTEVKESVAGSTVDVDMSDELQTEVTENTEAAVADESNLKTPADMSAEAQTEMYGFMMEYNKCMMQNRPEYHQDDARTEEIASKTFDECAPITDSLKAVLATNGVNKGLQEGMAKTLQQRASRKLMTAIMQAKAARMATGASAAPVMPVTTP